MAKNQYQSISSRLWRSDRLLTARVERQCFENGLCPIVNKPDNDKTELPGISQLHHIPPRYSILHVGEDPGLLIFADCAKIDLVAVLRVICCPTIHSSPLQPTDNTPSRLQFTSMDEFLTALFQRSPYTTP